MTFKYPQNMTLTQIAQWVDSNMYEDSCNEEKLCEYIYHLVHAYAKKHIDYKNYEQLDDFLLYSCSRFFIRLRRSSTSQPIKSIVNYIKSVTNLWYADYLRETSYGTPDAEYAEFDLFDFSDYLIDVSSEDDYHSYTLCYVDPSKVVYDYLKKIPVRCNSSEWVNIYISCLLTINNRIRTLVEMSKDLNDSDTIKYNKIMRKAKLQKPILFHVDETMENYIQTLVNELIHAISAEISYTISSKVSVSTCLKNLVIAANEAEDNV